MMNRYPVPGICYALTTIISVALLGLSLAATRIPAQDTPIARAIDAYVRPYVSTNNFSGQILVRRGTRTVYERNFGAADHNRISPIIATTRFHVASVSMQLTSAAVMRLVDQHRLTLDTRVSDLIPSVKGGDRITIRNLLEMRSGLSDINSRADYNDILGRHQTPASLVAVVANDTLLFAPGSKYAHEEHSAFNLLALIIEKATGLSFARAMQQLLFAPAGMTHSAIDDDSGPCVSKGARGYAPSGVADLVPAQGIHWSGKAGNASACTTARDEARFVQQLFHGGLLSKESAAIVTDTAGPNVGYGWFRRPNTRFGEFAFTMSGRAPGFASYVVYLPREDLTVVVLSNIYSSVTGDIGNDIAAIALGLPYKPLAFKVPLLPADSLGLRGLKFTFPADFYQPNATLEFVQKGSELFLRWPAAGGDTPLIPIDRDHLIDRAYWETVNIVRKADGTVESITYDRFKGTLPGN
jgi:CubicO group peptidase (beta-lactamase class C family)